MLRSERRSYGRGGSAGPADHRSIRPRAEAGAYLPRAGDHHERISERDQLVAAGDQRLAGSG